LTVDAPHHGNYLTVKFSDAFFSGSAI